MVAARACALGISTAFTLATTAANADGQPVRFESSAGVAYAAAFGNVLILQERGLPLATTSIGSVESGMVPVWLAIGARAVPWLELGVDGRLGFGPWGLNDIAAGLHAQVHPAPEWQFDPWVGVGAGAELLALHGLDASEGLEASVQGGVDVHVTRWLGVGPVVSLEVAQFDDSGQQTTFGWATVGGRVDTVVP